MCTPAVLHLLVVEDDPLLARLWRRIAARAGLRVSLAADVERALELLASDPVDGVISDFQLGARTSADLVRAIRRDHPGLPVVVVTGSPERARAALGEIVPICQKPAAHDEVLALLGMT